MPPTGKWRTFRNIPKRQARRLEPAFVERSGGRSDMSPRSQKEGRLRSRTSPKLAARSPGPAAIAPQLAPGRLGHSSPTATPRARQQSRHGACAQSIGIADRVKRAATSRRPMGRHARSVCCPTARTRRQSGRRQAESIQSRNIGRHCRRIGACGDRRNWIPCTQPFRRHACIQLARIRTGWRQSVRRQCST